MYRTSVASIVDNQEIVRSTMFLDVLQYSKIQIDLRILGVLQFRNLAPVMEPLSKYFFKSLDLDYVSGKLNALYIKYSLLYHVLRTHQYLHANVLSIH